ncbi:hypothetical protein [Streptomyces sp. NPDC005969]|uniref:hypothetical protein n=1 Tax=Streptomyces sp. NPDC005969 TaxID=3156722 RepID=UPI00340DF532
MQPTPPRLLMVAAKTWGDPAHADEATLRELDEIIDSTTKETDPARVVRVGTTAVQTTPRSVRRQARRTGSGRPDPADMGRRVRPSSKPWQTGSAPGHDGCPGINSRPLTSGW